MSLIYLLAIPTIGTMLWALHTKYQQRKMAEVVILLILAIAIYSNVCLVYKTIISQLSVGEHLVQMTSSTIILPLAYLYFARQVGKLTANNAVNVIMWVLLIITYIPEIIIHNPFEPLQLPEEEMLPFSLHVISDGHLVFSIHTGDLVAILQCFVMVFRIIPFMQLLSQHNLHLNQKVHALFACWALIIVFVIMVSSMSYEDLRSPFGTYFYFCFYALLLVFTNILIAKGYDMYPIETEQNEAVEDLNVYVQQQYSAIASKLREIMEVNKLYTDTQVTASHVIELLNTNHTYFSQMMYSEWGMSFSEYLNGLRLRHVKQLLSDDSLTISSIATQSGFADAGYMTRKFKAKYGITPSEWRKIH